MSADKGGARGVLGGGATIAHCILVVNSRYAGITGKRRTKRTLTESTARRRDASWWMRHAKNMLRALSILPAVFLLQPIGLAEGPTFDVASVKLSGPGAPRTPLYSGGPGTGDPGRLQLRVNMSLLLVAAFGVSVDQIKGPSWLRDFSAMPLYEIIATMPADSTKKQVETMLQNLLVERFRAVFHHETANFPGYELVVDKGGAKLKEVTPDPDPPHNSGTAGRAAIGSDGFPVVPGRRTMGSRPLTVHQRIKDQEWTMSDLASQLGFLLGRSLGKSLDDGFFQPRVIDRTGLAGKYTFILEYDCPACAPLVSTASPNPDAGNGPVVSANEPGGFPDIFGAVQKELGLRLIRTGDVPLEVIVVEALDKTPAAN